MMKLSSVIVSLMLLGDVCLADQINVIDENFDSLTLGDTTGKNAEIEDGTYYTGLKLENQVVGEVVAPDSDFTAASGQALLLTTSDTNGGWGILSATVNPRAVSLKAGQNITLSFDMYVLTPPVGTAINLDLRLDGVEVETRSFTELTGATANTEVNVSWTITVTEAMEAAATINPSINFEEAAGNYPNLNTPICQIDNLVLEVPFNPSSYYIDADGGNDSNDGLTSETAWATLAQANLVTFGPGEQILLQCGDTFPGKLELYDDNGSADYPILVSAYGEGDKPVINAAGYGAGIYVEGCDHIVVRDLEITADGGAGIDTTGKKYYGVYLGSISSDAVSNITLDNLDIHSMYPPVSSPSEGTNPETYMGDGINIVGTNDNRANNIIIKNCRFENLGYRVMFLNRADNVQVLNNDMINIGGPAMVPNDCDDLVVSGNVVDGSGQYTDTRMHGRGSGIWPINCERVLIEKNTFMHARGKYDSCGAHIDIGNHDVVIQYNLSLDNEGGFVEILGENYNCTYRYNISINDGARIKDVNGAEGDGHILLFSGHNFSGSDRSGGFNSYIYNNTIYVKNDQHTSFQIEDTVSGVFVANNLFYIEGHSVDGTPSWYDDYPVGIENTVHWKNNYYQRTDIFPTDWIFSETSPFYGNPQLANPGGFTAEDYIPAAGSPIEGNGAEITMIPDVDTVGLRSWTAANGVFVEGLTVTKDYFGNPIEGQPDIGAIEIGSGTGTTGGATFVDYLHVESSTAVSMTATEGPVDCEYYFTEITGSYGGDDSGWQTSPSYRDEGLLPHTTYVYTVTVRDTTDGSTTVSAPAIVTTFEQLPFPNHAIIDEDFSVDPNVQALASPFPVNTWYTDNSASWSTGSGINLSGTSLRLGWASDETFVHYYTDMTWDLTLDYDFTGTWKIIGEKTDNHLGITVGIGEYDPNTGELLQRIKEMTVGRLGPLADESEMYPSDDFTLTLSAAELLEKNVNTTSLIGIFAHRDDDGIPYDDDTEFGYENDVYSIDSIRVRFFGDEIDQDYDGVPDGVETALGFDVNSFYDGGWDLDGDGVTNADEYLHGTALDDENDFFNFSTTLQGGFAEIVLPGDMIQAGRFYFLDYKSSADAPYWQTVAVINGTDMAGSGDYTFIYPSSDVDAVFDIRVEWETEISTLAAKLVALQEGYQLLSFDFVPLTLDVKTLFTPVLDQIEFIQAQGMNKRLYKDGETWVNDIGNWDSTQAYLVKAKNGVGNLSVEKSAISLPATISLTTGVNLVPTYNDSNAGLETIFNSILESNIVWIRDANGRYLRKVNGSWIDHIKDTNAGSGLIMKVNGDCSFSY